MADRSSNLPPAAPPPANPPPATPPPATPATGSDGAERTFEDLMAELEQITDRLAGGELGIEAAVDLYEKAERLHALAAERLAQVQARVERLSRPKT